MASLPALLVEIPRHPVFAVGLPIGLGVLTGFVTRDGKYGPRSVWYRSLKKAKYDPPRWAFGVVWPILYASMGYTSHLIVKVLDRTPPGLGRDKANLALTLYWAQLALNMVWTPLNFVYGNLGLALADLVTLTGTLGYWYLTIRDGIDPGVAGEGASGIGGVKPSWLVLPYIDWCLYATYLNASLWWYNR